MSKQSIPYIKTRFESGDRPTGADYADLIDTLSSQATELGSNGNNNITPSDDIDHKVFGIENPTVIDSFSASEWRTIKYTVSISNTDENKTYTTELTVLIDNDHINVSQYGMIDNNGDIGTVDVSKNGDVVSLRVIPSSPLMPVTARYYRTGLKA